jgi:hypothetical protein
MEPTMTTNTNREAYYRGLALAEIDALISAGPDYLWLVTSGFENADDCCPDGQGGPDGWNRGGYWEFVYTSIASNIDAHIGRDAFMRAYDIGDGSLGRYDSGDDATARAEDWCPENNRY